MHIGADGQQVGARGIGDGPVALEHCRSCGHEGLVPVVSLGRQPLANALAASAEEAATAPRFPLDVVTCGGCGLAQLTVSVPPQELFGHYLYLSSFAPSVVESARTLVGRLIRERGLGSGDLAVEIASNDGYLLQHYLGAGVEVLGIDPAANIAPVAEARGVPTTTAFFSAELGEHLAADGHRASVVHANNVIAHVPDPGSVLRGVAALLRDDGIAVIETPSMTRMVDNVEYDTIYHEHLSYWSLTSLSDLLRRSGLVVVDVEEIPLHGGSLRVTAMREGHGVPHARVRAALADEQRQGVDRPAYFLSFGERIAMLNEAVVRMVGEARGQGRLVAGYGAAAKATVLLNATGLGASDLLWVADRSDVKQGRWIPGAALQVVAPEAITPGRPDLLLILAWNYAAEVMAAHRGWAESGGRFLVPVPHPRILGAGG